MTRRTKIGRYYVVRKRNGQILKWTAIGSSLRADRRKHSRHRPRRSGYGHTGDYRRRRR
jgi:hypothetical protein